MQSGLHFWAGLAFGLHCWPFGGVGVGGPGGTGPSPQPEAPTANASHGRDRRQRRSHQQNVVNTCHIAVRSRSRSNTRTRSASSFFSVAWAQVASLRAARKALSSRTDHCAGSEWCGCDMWSLVCAWLRRFPELGQRSPALNAAARRAAGARRLHRCVWAALALPICQFLLVVISSSASGG